MLIDVVTTLARLLTRHGNRVGAIVYGRRVEDTIPARGGRVQVLRLIDVLLEQPMHRQCPGDRPDAAARERPAADQAALARLRLSDFISAPGWERPLNLLNRRHEVIAIRLWDPRETILPDIGPMLMQDAETGEQLYVDTHDGNFRRRFEEAAAERERGLAATFTRAGVEGLAISTSEDLVQAIVRIAAQRRARRRN